MHKSCDKFLVKSRIDAGMVVEYCSQCDGVLRRWPRGESRGVPVFVKHAGQKYTIEERIAIRKQRDLDYYYRARRVDSAGG